LKGLVGRYRRLTPREDFIVYLLCTYLADDRAYRLRQSANQHDPAQPFALVATIWIVGTIDPTLLR
jgi:hypothetical protein